MTTSFLLPTAVTYNGTGVNGWANPDNILLVDNEYAVSTGATCILQVGNFNLSIPQDSNITNFTIRIKGYRGSFNTTLQLYAIDNTTGVELSYPAAPFQSFSGTNTLFTLPSTLFGTTWTVDQANNIQIKLIADGELHMDAIEISADYVPQVTPVPVPPSTGDVVVDEFVQGQRFLLASSITSSELYAFTQSFTLPDGTPIQYADFYGEALITMDQGIPGYEENIRLTAIDHNYQGTGLTRLSFGSINNRGLKFIYPYDHDINLCVPHNGTAEFVISNSAPFYDRFLRKNQINALVSAPIIVEDEGSALTDPAHTLDFQGAGVSVVNDGGDSFKKIITIPGNGTNPPNVVTTSSSTSGASQVPALTWSHVSSGLNRLLVVQVSTEAAATVSGITYNGVALTQAVTNTNGTLKSEQWYLIAPPVGTYNIIVSVTPNAYITAGAETLNTVDQSSPIGVTQTATGTSLTPSLVLATGTDNSLVIDSLVTGTLPIVYTAGAGQTENWHITATPNTRQGASSIEPAGTQPDNVTMSWAITQNVAWALNAIEVKGIAGPSGITVEDEGTPLTTTAQTLNFVGAGVTATGTGTTKTITIPGGGATLSLETDGTPNGDQTLLNLAAGTNITLTDNGTGTVTIDATGGSADELVAVSAADTTPGYLQPKLNVHSSDGSVTVTETITNPAGNEILDIDITAASGVGSPLTSTNGTTTKNAADASATQTIAHGLGQIPKEVTIKAISVGSSGGEILFTASAFYNGTTQSSNSNYRDNSVGAISDNTFSINTANATGAYSRGVITFDATNIYIAWTKTGGATGTYQILWEALAGGGAGTYAADYTAGSSAIQNSTQVHTITHNLGVIPRLINVVTQNVSTAGGGGSSCSHGNATVDGSGTILTQQVVTGYWLNGSTTRFDATAITQAQGNGFQVVGTLQNVTSTTFEISWAATANVNGTPNYVWEVFA